MTRRHFAALLLLLTLAGVAWAGINVEAYGVIGTRPAEKVTDGDGNDSVDLATALTGTQAPADTLGNPTIAVCAELSASGATVAVTVALYDTNGALMGVQTSTATAGSYRTAAAGDYVAPVLLFDSLGAAQYEVRHADPSTGTVDLRAWVYGSQSQ